jgi:hypothetical protein
METLKDGSRPASRQFSQPRRVPPHLGPAQGQLQHQQTIGLQRAANDAQFPARIAKVGKHSHAADHIEETLRQLDREKLPFANRYPAGSCSFRGISRRLDAKSLPLRRRKIARKKMATGATNVQDFSAGLPPMDLVRHECERFLSKFAVDLFEAPIIRYVVIFEVSGYRFPAWRRIQESNPALAAIHQARFAIPHRHAHLRATLAKPAAIFADEPIGMIRHYCDLASAHCDSFPKQANHTAATRACWF